MTPQDRTEEFKQRLFALMKEFGVVMTVRETTKHYSTYADGVEFYSYDHGVNLVIGNYEDGKS